MTSHNYKCVEREPKQIIVMDTTLRDGEQNSLCTMYPDSKVKIARMLEEMNVDIIESGFAVSNGSYPVMKKIAKIVKKPWLCGLARAVKNDIHLTYSAFRNYDKRMVHIFVPTSKVQVDAKMKKSEEELIEMVGMAVRYASNYFPVVEFTAEDSVRSDFSFLKRIYKEALGEGASVINVADTVGCAYFSDFGKLVGKVTRFVKKENKDARVSVHCHNDLGLALANTLSAIENGAEQVECTIAGIGERTGNCSLEQIAAWGMMDKGFSTGLDPLKLYKAAKMVEKATGIKNYFSPVIGETAHDHKSGVHQQGVLNNGNSYEVFDPKTFGRKSRIVIGPHSGYHGVAAKAEEFGYKIDKGQATIVIDRIFERVKKKSKRIFSDKDVGKMIQEVIGR